MQIVAGAEQAIGSDKAAEIGVPITFGILHAIDEHRAVHGKEDTIEREKSFNALEKFSFDFLIGIGGDRSAGHGCGDQGGQEGLGIRFEELEPLVLQRFVTTEDGEIFFLGTNAGVGGAFDANAAEGNALRG